MSLSNPKTITEVFAAHGITSARVCVLLECQELALAVKLQGKYCVLFETGRIGVEVSSWLNGTGPKDSGSGFKWVMSTLDLADIRLVREHLNTLLADSASDGGNSQ